jgi:hypothetical protein
MHHLRLLRLIGFTACLAGCQGIGVPPNLTSGITGTITRGPICPVQGPGTGSQCNDQPYAVTVIVSFPDGLVVTQFTAADDGTFRVPLEPGTYTLTPVSGPNGFPHAPPQDVTVPPDTFVGVQIQYDTGIR